MSLRFQINRNILIVSLLILILGGTFAIWQAKNAIKQEVTASINLAKQLIQLGISQTTQSKLSDSELLAFLSTLKKTRHLSILLKSPSGNTLKSSPRKPYSKEFELPPQWFIKLVSGHYTTQQLKIITENGQQYQLIIKAEPLDEITEVWQESINFFSILLLLILVTFLAINLAFNKALKAITVIINGLKDIETGQFNHKLPAFDIQEYDSIGNAINHLSQELEKIQQENRALTQHSLSIQEQERQHLSQELHDELGQSLTAIKVMAVTANHKNADSKKIMDEISQVCNHLINVVRNMMHQLHPLILDDLGLKAALQDMTRQWAERNPGISVDIQCNDNINQIKNSTAIHVFRIIQECLTNINRHAQAKQVKIEINMTKQKNLFVKVTDDGQGCDFRSNTSGFGLRSMKERIFTMNGSCNIESEPYKGLTLTAEIPVNE